MGLLCQGDRGEDWPSNEVLHEEAGVDLELLLLSGFSYSERTKGCKKASTLEHISIIREPKLM